jgi:PAS domain S-box-containing protein
MSHRPNDEREMARRVAELDWSTTPLGPYEGWSVSLRSAVRILLTSQFAMWMAWGPELTMLYNDAYRRNTLRAKHPWALGQPANAVWAEIWEDIGPRIDSVLESGIATWDEDLLLFLERSGYPEETYHTFSYSPLADDDGAVAGMLCVVVEETDRVLSERRMATLRELGSDLAVTGSEEQTLATVGHRLGTNLRDLPFSLVYLFDDGPTGRLAAAAGITAVEAGDAWPVGRLYDGETVVVEDLRPGLPSGAWPDPPQQAVVVPLSQAGQDRPAGFLVAGLSPFRPYDERYRGFVEVLANQIGSGLGNARAYDAERRRAEALAELDRAKTEFFTGISHEFRTPLTLLQGPIEQLRAHPAVLAAPDVADELDVAHRNGLRLARLVNTLLDFSRLQAGRMQARFAPTDLSALTAELAGMFRSAVERAGLAFTVHVALDEPVWVDRESWEKIVLNLLSNALKFSFNGGITVGLRRVDTTAVLEVADTGIGIPAADLDLLFDRFHQVRGARGRSAEGSGIGLALARELVALHGGTISAASRLGEGSTFTVRLPFGSAHLPAEQLAPDAAEPGRVRSADPFVTEAVRWLDEEPAHEPADDDGRPRVLVADDNADMREYLTRLLSPHYAVTAVADGAAALSAARADPPDLLLTDVMMPELDGFALLTALRADPALATLPVVVLSARAGQEAAAEGLAAGADDYLVKPFTTADLLARVRSTLALASLRSEEARWRRRLVASLQDGFFVVDAAGQVVEINDAFTAIFGYGPEGLPYPAPHPWWPDPGTDAPGYARLMTAMAEIQEAGRGRHLLALYHRDGRRLWIETSADTVPSPDRPDGPPMLIGVARDVTDRHHAAARDRLLAKTGRLLATSEHAHGGLDQRLRQGAELAAAVFEDLVVIVRTAPDGRMAPLAAAHPDQPEPAAAMLELAPYRIPEALLPACLSGRTFVLDPTPTALRDRDRPGPHATLVAPLVAGGRLVGLLTVICPGDHPAPSATPLPPLELPGPRAEPSRRFDRAEAELAEELARRIAVAMEAERVAAREHQLNSAAAALATAATVTEAAAALAAALRDALQAGLVAVYTSAPERPDRLVLQHHVGSADTHAVLDLARTGRRWPAVDAVSTGSPIWLPDERAWSTRYPHLADDTVPVVAAAALPLRLAGRTLGAVTLAFPTAREFPADERGFATTLVGLAAQTLQRALDADRQRSIAAVLQQSLLPSALPEHHRLALATRYLPAAEVEAGGDWYDVFLLDDDRIAFAVGDVVGHGASAAATMGQLRAALAAYLLDGASPAQALARLDRFSRRVPDAKASSASCAVLDITAGELTWACAGHPPPLLVDGERTAFAHGVLGPVLGLWDAPPMPESHLVLQPGSGVLFYTDGLVERRGELIDDGMRRLADAAHRWGGRPVAPMLTAVIGDVLPETGPRDDVAALLVQLLPAPLSGEVPARPDRLREIRLAVQGWTGTAYAAELVDDLQLALGEAVANAVEHAYGPDDDGHVRYRITARTDGGLDVAVDDDGTWRPPPADRGFRGRGIEMIRRLAAEAAIDVEDGTHVRFTMVPAVGPPVRSAATTARRPDAPAELDTSHDPDGRLRLGLAGDVDLESVAGLRPGLFAALDGAEAPAVLDLHRVTYLSSAGVGLLLDVLAGAPVPVTLSADPDGPVARILALTGIRPPG